MQDKVILMQHPTAFIQEICGRFLLEMVKTFWLVRFSFSDDSLMFSFSLQLDQKMQSFGGRRRNVSFDVFIDSYYSSSGIKLTSQTEVGNSKTRQDILKTSITFPIKYLISFQPVNIYDFPPFSWKTYLLILKLMTLSFL